jgi:hypothetical protein
MSNQISEARDAVRRLLANPTDASALTSLREVLDRAQNPPPLGVADGSISEDLWVHLNGLYGGFVAVQRALDAIRRGLKTSRRQVEEEVEDGF